MKVLLALVTLASVTSSFAFTNVNTYECLSGDEVAVKSFLSPAGERLAQGALNPKQEERQTLRQVACALIERPGSDECFVGNDVKFTSIVSHGILYKIVNGVEHYTPCTLKESIQ